MKELLDADQRLIILRSLADCGGRANESILHECVKQYGHSIARDVVKDHLLYLASLSLIKVESISDFDIAALTGRGEDVAQGLAIAQGVRKPRASE